MFSKIVLAAMVVNSMSSGPLGVIPATLIGGVGITQYVVSEDTIFNSKIKEDYEVFEGVYTPTVALNIREEPWGDVQTVLSPGVELEASRVTHLDEVDWVEVSYKDPKSGKQVVGWTSKNYIQDFEEYEYELANPTYLANHIYYNGTSRPYKSGGYANGQYIIDTSDYASTWGGTQAFSGYDGLSTHLIGHSHMQFQNLMDAWEFIVTDDSGNAFQYNRVSSHLVDEYGTDLNSGSNLYDMITGTWGGERVILQTTEVHPRKWIIVTEFAGQVN